MLARAILILSCLLCTRALAQAPAAAGSDSAAVSASASAPPAPSTPTAQVQAQVQAQAQAQAQAQVQATEAQATEAQATEAQAIQSAVPVDRQALVPVTEPPPKRALESEPLFTPAVVLIGTGGAALLASLFTGLGAHGIYNSLETACVNNICSRDKEQRISSGKALALVSTVLTGVGVAAAGVGTALLILAATNDDQPPPQSNFGFASLRLTSGPTPLGVGAAGSF